jgi:NAD-dependent deacetylase
MNISKDLADKCHASKYVVVLTGAGISAESGVPTFRDAQTGFWENYKPEDLATPQAFRRNPKLVWEWYAMRREMVKKVQPNAGHFALADIEKCVSQFMLITQNVDNLHFRAGSRNIIELHGNIERTKCLDEDVVITSWTSEEIPPRCPRCGSLMRPDVVWFGEMLPPGAFAKAEEAIARCDLFFSIGTSGLVYPAAGLPFEALKNGVTTVEVNPDETPLTAHADFALRGASGRILPEIAACFQS